MILTNTNLKTNEALFKDKSMFDTETTGKDRNQTIMIDQIVVKSLENGDNNGSVHLESLPHMSFLHSPGAFHVRKLTMESLLDKHKLNGLEFTTKTMNFFSDSSNRDFYAQNASFDETALIHTQDRYALTSPYQHKFNGNTLNDLMSLTKAYVGLIGLDMYDKERGLYSISQENLSKNILKEDDIQALASEFSRHNAAYDVAEGILLMKIMLENSRLSNYVTMFKNPDIKTRLLKHPIFLEHSWHHRSGSTDKLCMLFKDHPKFKSVNWMNKIRIDPDHLFQEDIGTTINLIKKNVKFTSFKTSTLNFIFPNGSKTFEESFPGCTDDYFLNIHRALDQDFEFRDKMNKYWDKQKTPERKYSDVYDFKHDGPISSHDQNISILFHEAKDPRVKGKYADMFDTTRLKNNAKRVMLYYFGDYMDPKEKKYTFEKDINELNKKEASRVTFQECEDSFDKLFADETIESKDKKNLEEYQTYIKALKANPKLFLGE